MVTKTIEVGKIYQLIHGTITVFVLIVAETKGSSCYIQQGGGKFLTLEQSKLRHRIMYHCDWKELMKE
jgi:hypothetical protein